MYLIDTNIFLEVMLSRGRKEYCKELLRRLRDGREEGIVTDFTIHSIIVIMDKFEKLRELKEFLSSLSAYKGLYVFHTNLAVEVEAVERALEGKLDMDDAIQYSSAVAAGVKCIISYDKHFDGLDIPRKTPEEVLR